MSEFSNVTAVKEANIYFDGKVTSRTLITPPVTAALLLKNNILKSYSSI